MNEWYYEYMMIKDNTKIWQDYHSWEHSNSSMEAESDSWIWIDSKELAATAAQDAILLEYEEFQHLFNQPEQPELLIYRPHDHTIPLEGGKNPACKKIYSISEKESHALWEYIDKQLKKGTIRASKSPAGHGVLFIPKKDRSLWLCVDYQPLNAITIKDRHPLPWINKM